MQTVSDRFRTKAYSGEALYHTILQIEEQEVPIEQISSIEIDSPIVDNTSESFYLGTFISQSLKIKFKNLDGLNIASNKEVYLQIGEERESYNLFNKDTLVDEDMTGIVNHQRLTSRQLLYLDEGTYTFSTNLDTQIYSYSLSTVSALPAPSYDCYYTTGYITDSIKNININSSQKGYFLLTIRKINNQQLSLNDIKVFDYQLQEGTEATSYEPFGTIIEYVPIGRFLIDDLAEDYFETCEITCLDYAVKLKPNIDYSPCFTRQSEEDTPTATVQTIFNYICNYFGIEVETDISNLPNINVEVGTFDGSISGKQWISYLAEIMGCNAKINRDGKLILIPLKHEKSTTINALESEEFTLGEKFEISRVVYFDAVRNFTYGEDIHNTLFIRQDNPFIVDGDVVENIYNTLFDYSPKTSNKSELISINDGNDDIPAKITMYGNAYQETTTGKNIFNILSWYNKNPDHSWTGSGTFFVTEDRKLRSGVPNKRDYYSYLPHMTKTPTQAQIDLIKEYAFEVLPSTRYNLSFVNEDEVSCEVLIFQYDEEGKYITHISAGTNANKIRVHGLTTTATTKYMFFRFDNESYSNPEAQALLLSNLQLEQGSATEYEEFSYGKSPNPNYSQPIEAVTGEITLDINGNEQTINLGKNLFDKDNANIINNAYIGGTATKITASGSGLKLLYISIDGGKTYTVSKIQGTVFRVATTEELPALDVTTSPTYTNETATQITYQTNNNANYLVVNYFGNSDTLTEQEILNSIQIEEGTEATEYTPYSTPIELCKIGDYQDYIRKSTGKNLYDGNAVQGRWNINVGNVIAPNTQGGYRSQNAINIEPNTTYTISGIITTAGGYIVETNENDVILAINGNNGYIPISYTANVPFEFTFTSHSQAHHLYWYIASGSATQPINLMVELGDSATEYEPYGEVWYKYGKIGKIILNGSENWTYISSRQGFTLSNNFTNRKTNVYNGYCNYFIVEKTDTTWTNINYCGWNSNNVFWVEDGGQIATTENDFKSWLSTHNTVVYYVLAAPIAEIITNETLIAQLESVLRPTLLNGDNTITTTNDLKPYLQMDYISKNYFKIWSLQTKNYGDISLDAWDIIEYTLGEDEYHNPITYQTYNNNHINYEMNIASEVNTQIPTKQREITTNIYDNNEEVRVKMIKTLLDYVNAEVILQAEEQREQSRRLTQLRLDIESIQNIFQITGGSNLITNSQFLFDDPIDNETQLRTYWNFTDNGSNPYQNIGSGFDGSLAGQTTSVAKIQLRDIIAETSIANIIGLKEGQTYTLNYSYKQDELTTTNFQLFDSNGNIVSYSVYNEETETYETKQIDFTYDSEETNYKNETIQFTAPTSSLILKITTNTLSGDTNSGYFYLYDLMLNSGDKKTWEPAKSEVYSTVLKMSQLGLQVMATGSNIATLINADGFRIFKLNGNNLGEEITTFNDKGLITGIAETDEVHTGNYVMTEIQINNTEHHVEYFKERN